MAMIKVSDIVVSDSDSLTNAISEGLFKKVMEYFKVRVAQVTVEHGNVMRTLLLYATVSGRWEIAFPQNSINVAKKMLLRKFAQGMQLYDHNKDAILVDINDL